MSTLLVLLAATLTPGQAGLSLTNARTTYGELGAIRTDTRYVAGDIFFVAFDIEGIKADETGRVRYTMSMEVVNKDNQPIYTQRPLERDDFIPLGGNKLPGRAFVTIGPDQAPGAYTCRVTVSDLAAKSKQVLEQKFEVVPKSFGFVQVFTSSDEKGAIPAPPLGVPGQAVFLRFALIGFSRDAKTKQPNFDIEMVIQSKDGAAALAKPAVLTIDRGVDESDNVLPLRFFLPMNRVGDFTIELRATDKINKATGKVQIPLRVVAP